MTAGQIKGLCVYRETSGYLSILLTPSVLNNIFVCILKMVIDKSLYNSKVAKIFISIQRSL